jgi:hypothetical protein
MPDGFNKFLRDMASLSPDVTAAIQEEATFWRDEEVPSTLAAASIGRFLAERFEDIEPGIRMRAFALIEAAAGSADEHLNTSVCTGLLEALLHKAERMGTWDRVREHLGPNSLEYVNAWIDFIEGRSGAS